jgi:arabinogalactan endo-1,4-beta-galactosidase
MSLMVSKKFFFLQYIQKCEINSQDLFAKKGADVGWLPQMEATDKFYDGDGTRKRLFATLKDRGMNVLSRLVFGWQIQMTIKLWTLQQGKKLL